MSEVHDAQGGDLEYMVVGSWDHGDFCHEVNRCLKDGWQLQGSVSVTCDDDCDVYHSQAMVWRKPVEVKEKVAEAPVSEPASTSATPGSPKVVGTLCVGKRVFNLRKCDPESVYLYPLENFDVLWIVNTSGILTLVNDGGLIQKRMRVVSVDRSMGRVWVQEV